MSHRLCTALVCCLFTLGPSPASADPELRASASSELKSKKHPGRYAPGHLLDGKPETAWVEGHASRGEGQWIRLESGEPLEVEGFLLRPGYARSKKTFLENATPRKVVLRIDGEEAGSYTIPYRMKQRGEEAPTTKGGQEALECYPSGGHDSLRMVLFERPRRGKRFELRIETVLAGTRYADLAISEWRLLVGGPTDPELAPVPRKILRSVDGLRGKIEASSVSTVKRSADLRGSPTLKYEMGADERVEARLQEAFAKQVRLPQVEKGAPEAAKTYLAEHRFAFFDRIVTLEVQGEGWRVLGGQAARSGDGEWWELYPELHFDAGGTLIEVREGIHADGAPGCTDALP